MCIVYNVFKVNNVYGVFISDVSGTFNDFNVLKARLFHTFITSNTCFKTTLAEVIKMYCLMRDVQFVAHSVSLTLFLIFLIIHKAFSKE